MTKMVPFFKASAQLLLLLILPFVLASNGQTPSGQALNGQALSSQRWAGPNRPPQVPEGYVVTPFGYFHPSCVLRITEGEMLLEDGRIQHENGVADANAPFCSYPRFSPTGALITAGTTIVKPAEAPIVNGWVESVWATASTSYGKISATWTVPPQPSVNDNQTVFFFPGLEDINAVQSILQPVLQWYAPGPWAVASWNCCLSGITVESTPVTVSPGDTIVGTITPTCKAGLKYCAKWNIVSEDKTTGKKTTLSKTPSDGQVWNWGFGAVLEAYGILRCQDYPANKNVVFDVQLYDQNRNLITSPPWTKAPAGSSTTPKCGYGLNVTATKETVKY
jgi:hypothetical protein